MDKTQRTEIEAQLVELRREIRELQDERLALDKSDAVGAKRHAFLGDQIRLMRLTESKFDTQLLDELQREVRRDPL